MNRSLRRGRGVAGRSQVLALLVSCLSAAAVLAGGTTAAQAATACPAGANTWTGNAHDGSWGTPGNWSQGNAPGTTSTTEDVCLPDSATAYTVTLAPFQYNNNINNPPEAHLSANSLTVGNGATLVIHGASSNGNYSSSGDDTTQLALTNGGSISTGGTLELLATDDNDGGGASDNGGRGSITGPGGGGGGGTLTNAGTITSVSQTTQGSAISHQNELGITLQNAPGANLAVTGGTLVADNGQTLTNDGTITIAPGAQLNESPSLFIRADTFTNAADGTIAAQIAAASSFGTIHFGGNTTVNLGGALAPSAVNGYAPAVGSAFALIPLDSNVAFGLNPKVTGTFGVVSGGFAADYSHETTSPAYIGVVYGAAGGTGGPTPTPTPTPPPPPKPSTLGYGTASVKGIAVRLTLTCSAGGGCTRATVRETIRVRVKGRTILGIATGKTKSTKKIKIKVLVIGTRSLTPASGRSTTVAVSLNATGRRLLARFHRLRLTVTVATGGKVRKTYTPTVNQPKARKRKHHRHG